MLTKSKRFVSFANCSVSGFHNCHAVGLSICERTYGLLLSPQRLVSESALSGPLGVSIVVVVAKPTRKELRAGRPSKHLAGLDLIGKKAEVEGSCDEKAAKVEALEERLMVEGCADCSRSRRDVPGIKEAYIRWWREWRGDLSLVQSL